MSGYADKDGKDRPRKSATKQQKGYAAPFRGFLNYTPTEPEKANFDAWCESASLWERLEYEVTDGVNLSLKIDPKGDGFLASATQRREDSPNAGLVVTARAREPWKALARVLFTLACLSRGKSWEEVQPMADPDRWS